MDKFRDIVHEYTELLKNISEISRQLKVKRDRVKNLEKTITSTMNSMNVGIIKTRNGNLEFSPAKNGDQKLVLKNKTIVSAPFQLE